MCGIEGRGGVYVILLGVLVRLESHFFVHKTLHKTQNRVAKGLIYVFSPLPNRSGGMEGEAGSTGTVSYEMTHHSFRAGH